MMVEDGLPPSAVSGRQTIFHHHRILKGRRQERGHVCASTVSAVLCMFSVCSPWSWISDVCVDLLSANVLTFIKMKKIWIIQLKPLALWRYQSAHLWIFFCNCKLKTRVWTMSKYFIWQMFTFCIICTFIPQCALTASFAFRKSNQLFVARLPRGAFSTLGQKKLIGCYRQSSLWLKHEVT